MKIHQTGECDGVHVCENLIVICMYSDGLRLMGMEGSWHDTWCSVVCQVHTWILFAFNTTINEHITFILHEMLLCRTTLYKGNNHVHYIQKHSSRVSHGARLQFLSFLD